MKGRAVASGLDGNHDPVALRQDPLCVDLSAAHADIHQFGHVPAFPQEEKPFPVDDNAELFLYSRVFAAFLGIIHGAIPGGFVHDICTGEILILASPVAIII
jgi:hypothetical protein